MLSPLKEEETPFLALPPALRPLSSDNEASSPCAGDALQEAAPASEDEDDYEGLFSGPSPEPFEVEESTGEAWLPPTCKELSGVWEHSYSSIGRFYVSDNIVQLASGVSWKLCPGHLSIPTMGSWAVSGMPDNETVQWSHERHGTCTWHRVRVLEPDAKRRRIEEVHVATD